MQVFVYDIETDLNSFFQKTSAEIPFLNSDLISFLKERMTAQSLLHKEEVKIHEEFTDHIAHLPKDNRYELVFFIPPTTLLVGDISKEDMAFLRQNPGKLYTHNDIIAGYISRESEMVTSPEDEPSLFSGSWVLSLDNFLHTNQMLISQLHLRNSVKGENVTIYGSPLIMSENVRNSTICGPSFIGPDASVEDSYVAPGTIISGVSHLNGAKVFSSFIHNSTLSGEIHNSLITESSVENMTLGSGCRLPNGTVLGSNVLTH